MWFLTALGKIFGSKEVMQAGIELIDDAWTTEEESLEARANAKIALMNAYAPFKVAQRYLAVMFSLTFLFSFFLVLVMTLAGKDVKAVYEVLEQFNIGWIMMTIVGFYFAGGAIESIKGIGQVEGKKS